jgi:hypothetical protein
MFSGGKNIACDPEPSLEAANEIGAPAAYRDESGDRLSAPGNLDALRWQGID